MISTLVSRIFLVVIALLNLMIWVDIWRFFRSLWRGAYQPESLDALLTNRGFVARIAKPLWRYIGKSWHVYPLGRLFGLGFDTASQINLLALSAGSARALSWSGILALPLLFAAGMSLMDTADLASQSASGRAQLSVGRPFCPDLGGLLWRVEGGAVGRTMGTQQVTLSPGMNRVDGKR